MLAIAAIPAGLLIGLSLGALGGGGSILTVPALVYLLHQQPHAATTGSLLIVGITALAGMTAHQRAGRVRIAAGHHLRRPRRRRLLRRHAAVREHQPRPAAHPVRRAHAGRRRRHAAPASGRGRRPRACARRLTQRRPPSPPGGAAVPAAAANQWL